MVSTPFHVKVGNDDRVRRLGPGGGATIPQYTAPSAPIQPEFHYHPIEMMDGLTVSGKCDDQQWVYWPIKKYAQEDLNPQPSGP
jgi:hypothetical protein